MYLATNVHITFPEFKGKKRTSPRKEIVFKSVSTFKIDKTWQSLTDTCEFVIAKKLFKKEGTGSIVDLIQTGDKFYLQAGYNGNYYREFTGYISEILDELPVTFKCEDNMYILKRTPVNKSFKGVKLITLLKAIVPQQFKIDCADVTLGDFLFKNFTVAKVLTELKDNYGLYSYFVDDTLVVGKIYLDNPNYQVVKYVFDRNVISNDLKYRNKNDYQIKVTMTSHLSNGKKLRETVGDAEGVEQKLVCTNVKDRAEIRKLAQKELDRLRFDGYRGSLTGFGIPFVQHGFTVQLINKQNPDKDGNYYVDGVTLTLDNKGALRRTSKIGKRAAK